MIPRVIRCFNPLYYVLRTPQYRRVGHMTLTKLLPYRVNVGMYDEKLNIMNVNV